MVLFKKVIVLPRVNNIILAITKYHNDNIIIVIVPQYIKCTWVRWFSTVTFHTLLSFPYNSITNFSCIDKIYMESFFECMSLFSCNNN